MPGRHRHNNNSILNENVLTDLLHIYFLPPLYMTILHRDGKFL